MKLVLLYVLTMGLVNVSLAKSNESTFKCKEKGNKTK